MYIYIYKQTNKQTNKQVVYIYIYIHTSETFFSSEEQRAQAFKTCF